MDNIYYAFISYKREDKRWAKKLQRKLEYYKLPTFLLKNNPSLPSRIKPVFRDTTDLSGVYLEEAINKALDSSRYLIVICSPKAANSQWVCKEVRRFVDTGKEANIIPFIIKGEPHSSSAERECFPRALRELTGQKELLGINIKESGFNYSVIKIVATMFSLRLDQLIAHEEVRKRTRRLVLSLLSILLFGLSFFAWECFRPKYEYYADYVKRYDIPSGILPVSKNDMLKRNRTYRFEYRHDFHNVNGFWDWRLVRVANVNSFGISKDEDSNRQRYALEQLHYDTNGDVSQILSYDQDGRCVVNRKITLHKDAQKGVIDFLGTSNETSSGYLTDLEMNTDGGVATRYISSIKRVVHSYDCNGYTVKESFHSNNDDELSSSITQNSYGVYGQMNTVDSLGRIIRISYFGKTGEAAEARNGIATTCFDYDDNGNIRELFYQSLDGSPAHTNLYRWKTVFESNAEGNIVLESRYLSDGTNIDLSGVSHIAFEYDQRGNIVQQYFMDESGVPCVNNEGYGRIRYEIDKRGNITRSTKLTTSGAPCATNGYCTIKMEYNRHNKMTYISYIDPERWYCTNPENGATHIKFEYDKHQNVTGIIFYDSNWKRILNKQGYSEMRRRYDKDGKEISMELYDVDRNRCMCNDGYSRMDFSYSENGRLASFEYYDENDNRCRKKNGAFRTEFYPHSNGNLLSFCNLDENNNPCSDDHGIISGMYVYDNLYRVTEFRTNSDKGTVIIRTKYDDDQCLKTQITCDEYDAELDGRPYVTKTFCNNIGIQTEVKYSRKNGAEFVLSGGYSCVKTTYNKRGQLLSEGFYRGDDLCMSNMGFSLLENSYDSLGRRTAIAYYDDHGAPCAFNGLSRRIWKFGEVGRLEEQVTYDQDGNLCAGNDGEPARVVIKYNEQGYAVEYTNYGVDGKLALLNGYAIAKVNFDKDGYKESVSLYDEDGHLLSNSSDIHMITEGVRRIVQSDPSSRGEYDERKFNYGAGSILGSILYLIFSVLFIIGFFIAKGLSFNVRLCFLAVSPFALNYSYLVSIDFFVNKGWIAPVIYNNSWIVLCMSTLIAAFLIINLISFIVKGSVSSSVSGVGLTEPLDLQI